MTDPSQGQARLLDALCDTFEEELRAGRAPSLERYLDRVDPPLQDRLLRELLAVEVEYRLRRGERPRLEDYLPRFPDRGPALLTVFSKAPPEPARLPAASTQPTGAPAPAAGPSPLGLTLTVLEGHHQGQVFTFAAHDVFLVGRSRRCHLCVDDPYLSRYHFLVEINPPACRLSDMGSRNRTLVNGEPVPANQSRMVRDGDRIQAGHTVLGVSLRFNREDLTDADGAATLMLDAPPSPALPHTAAYSAPGPSVPAPPPAPEPALSTAPPTGQSAPPAPADVFPYVEGYRLERELGRGGMGVVYKARRESDGLACAVKTIVPAVQVAPKQTQRFVREANILCQLQHHHIVTFLEVGECDGILFFAMSYIDGTDAARLLRAQGPLPVRTAVRITHQLLSALKFAHAKGFVHRDVKPANILVTQEAGKSSVKLADFGLARVYQESRMSGLTVEGDVGGTVAFMAPEQILNFRQTKPSADLYSAAATLYNLLTGKMLYPFDQAAKGQALALVLQGTPIPIRDHRPEVPEDLAAIIHRGLAKAPEDRFATAQDFQAALLPFV